MRSGCRAGRAPAARPDRPSADKPSSNQARKAAAERYRNSSSGLLENGVECDRLEALERRRTALDFHAQDCALPGGEEEFREIVRREGRGDVAGGLRLGDASRKGGPPLREDFNQAGAQHLAMGDGLEAEIADQTATCEAVGGKPRGYDVEIASQSLAGRQALVIKRLGNEALRVLEVAVKNLAREDFFRPKMVGEGALGGLRLSHDVAHARPDISLAKHHLKAGVEDLVAQRWLCHSGTIRTNVLKSSHFVNGAWGILSKRTNFGIPNEINGIQFP